jgi:hypothetical protein
MTALSQGIQRKLSLLQLADEPAAEVEKGMHSPAACVAPTFCHGLLPLWVRRRRTVGCGPGADQRGPDARSATHPPVLSRPMSSKRPSCEIDLPLFSSLARTLRTHGKRGRGKRGSLQEKSSVSRPLKKGRRERPRFFCGAHTRPTPLLERASDPALGSSEAAYAQFSTTC